MTEGLYPLVEYARMIKKNTADLTAADMAKYMTWWMKQPNKAIVESTIKKQLSRARQVHDQQQLQRAEDKNMGKQSKMKAAHTSRLPVTVVEEEMEVEEMEVIDMEAELETVNQKIAESDIVCDMGLTKGDVEALLFCLDRIFVDYDLTGHVYEESLKGLKTGLLGALE